jgi:hypothetical protein
MPVEKIYFLVARTLHGYGSIKYILRGKASSPTK